MTDKTHRHLMLQIELCLEGKQTEHQVAALANLQHALLPPGPDGRTDIVHRANARLTQLQFNVEGEIRRIDANEHIGFLLDQGANQTLTPCQQFRQAAEHLDQPHHRETLHGEIGAQPLSLHQRTTDADELDLGMPLAQGLHQASTQDIAGRFARDQRNTQFAHERLSE